MKNLFCIVAHAQPNGGRSYTNAAGERVRYQSTSRQGRYYERTGQSGLGATNRTRGVPTNIRRVG